MRLSGQEEFVIYQEGLELDYKERRRKKMMEKENIIHLHSMFQLIHLTILRQKLQNNND